MSPGGSASSSQASTLNPVAVFSAIGNPLRWQLMQMMADGSMLSASQAAGVVKRDIDIVIKHLGILWDAGLVHRQYSPQDGRILLYYIPEVWRPQPDILDYGCCVVRLPANRS